MLTEASYSQSAEIAIEAVRLMWCVERKRTAVDRVTNALNSVMACVIIRGGWVAFNLVAVLSMSCFLLP